jgi:cyanophycin synthetase
MDKNDCANWQAAHRVLMNRAVEAAVIEHGFRSILTEGIAYDRCQVGVVTNIDADASLPDLYIDDADQVFNVARTQVDIVLPDGVAVLNGADERVARMAELCDGDVIFFSASPDNDVVAQHRAQGGRAVYLRDGQVILANGAHETSLVKMSAIGISNLDRRAYVAENVLAAVAAGWALGIASDVILAAAETFDYGA